MLNRIKHFEVLLIRLFIFYLLEIYLDKFVESMPHLVHVGKLVTAILELDLFKFFQFVFLLVFSDAPFSQYLALFYERGLSQSFSDIEVLFLPK